MSSIRDFFPIEYKVGGVKPKKNFLLENKKNVTKLTKLTCASKENEKPSNKLSNTNIQKNNKKHEYNKSLINKNSKKIDLDKIDASIKSIRSAIAQTKITQKKLDLKNRPFALKNQATQTVNPYDEDDILKDSIIRYPKLENSNIGKHLQETHMNTIAVQTENFDLNYPNSMSKKDLKCTKRQENVNDSKKKPINSNENVKGHHQPGEIPKYLKNRKALKEKNEKETQKKLAIRHELGLDDPACPPGHVLLPEPERLDHLSKIKKDYSRLIIQLNTLPVSSDSYKMKEKQKNLEKELDRLQLGIKLFSREKLFVNVNPKLVDLYK